jgi:hypothetical protein
VLVSRKEQQVHQAREIARVEERRREAAKQKLAAAWDRYTKDTNAMFDRRAKESRRPDPRRVIVPESPPVQIPPVNRGLWERLMTISIWASFILCGVPLQHASGLDWQVANWMTDQLSIPLGLAFLSVYGLEIVGIRGMQQAGRFRQPWVVLIPLSFVYLAAHFSSGFAQGP